MIIANPAASRATVDLVPHLTSGSIRPDEREVFIKPGEAVVRPLGDEAPTGLKPSIEVVARAGRVVVGAAVSSGGRAPTLLPAQGAAKPAWSFAGGISGGGRQAQVLVTNPNPTPLQVELQITTAKATFRPEGDFGEPIANGGTAELAIPALDVKGPFAVRVRYNKRRPVRGRPAGHPGAATRSARASTLAPASRERLAGPGHPRRRQVVLANLPEELEAASATSPARQRRRAVRSRRPGSRSRKCPTASRTWSSRRFGRAGGGARGRRPDRTGGHRRPPAGGPIEPGQRPSMTRSRWRA